MQSAAPFISSPMQVEKDWIDYNGHMNMAYYNVLFDRCADQAFDHLGIGAEYARSRSMTIYTAEIHVCYVRELHLGDEIQCSFHLLDHDAKRLHVFQEITHRDGWLSATCEALSLHVDMTGPRVATFPDDVASNVTRMAADHAGLPKPERSGRTIGIRRKSG